MLPFLRRKRHEAQPYRVIIPSSYDKAKPIPLYVYLHGRGDTDFETNWVGGPDRAGNGGGGNGTYIQLQVFGRFNCSYRWAGETDILEAIQSVRKRYNIDADRIVLAGFSMGGAGSWQTGLHYPDLFAALEVDAGVIGSRRSTAGLAPAQKAGVVHYGVMIDHALNVFNVPLVAYAGERDAQLASTSIREQLVREGFTVDHPSTLQWKAKEINALFLAIPNAGHAHASGETDRIVKSFVADAMKRGRVVPDHVRFVTYTTRYNHDYWVTVDGLQRHFERADVDAIRDSGKATFTVKTKNVSRLLLTDMAAARKITIDGDALTVQPSASILLERKADHWRLAEPEAEGTLRKKQNLQGPIDDAFLDSFLCVTPSGQPFNAIADEYAKQELARFTREFGKTYRGDVRTREDTAVTPAELADHNLILFGDPGSNKLLGQILDKLPIKWTKETIEFNGKTYRASEHVPVLIYPNPLNPKRYVVINSGMTAQDRSGTSSYGDCAIVKVTNSSAQRAARLTTQIAESGVFDESWKLPARR